MKRHFPWSSNKNSISTLETTRNPLLTPLLTPTSNNTSFQENDFKNFFDGYEGFLETYKNYLSNTQISKNIKNFAFIKGLDTVECNGKTYCSYISFVQANNKDLKIIDKFFEKLEKEGLPAFASPSEIPVDLDFLAEHNIVIGNKYIRSCYSTGGKCRKTPRKKRKINGRGKYRKTKRQRKI